MRTITKEEAVTLHRKMWNEIANMIHEGIQYTLVSAYKEGALDRLGIERTDAKRPLQNCFACEYAKQNVECNMCLCSSCPLNWTGAEHRWDWKNCQDEGSPYRKFTYALSVHKGLDYEKAEQYAREIANLPERTEV